MENKRNFFRLTLRIPISASMKIIGAHGKEIESSSASAMVVDLGPGGLGFHSPLDMPPKSNILLEFRFVLFHEEIKVLTTIVRKKTLPNGIHEYGTAFSIEEHNRAALTGKLNILAVRLKRAATQPSCSFATEEELEDFYGSQKP